MNYHSKSLLPWNDVLTKIECIYPGPEPIYISINLDRLMSFALTRTNDLGEFSIEHWNKLSYVYYLKIFNKSIARRRVNNKIIYNAFVPDNPYISMTPIHTTITLKLLENKSKVLKGLDNDGIRYELVEGYYNIFPDTIGQLIGVNTLITKYIDK